MTNMVKSNIIYILIMLLFLITLSACNNEKEEVGITINVYKHHQFDQTYSMYNFLVASVLIEDYSEYDNLLAKHKDAEFVTLHSREFFEDNKILLIPVISNKMPEFVINEYSYYDGILELNIEQINSLIRDIDYNDYYTSQYFLEIIISNTDILDYKYQITENNDYYKSIVFTSNINLGMNGNYLVIDSLSDFEVLFSGVELTNDVENNFGALITEELFSEHIVFVYQHIGCGNTCEDNNYVFPMDLGIIESSSSTDAFLTIYLYESTNKTPSFETTSTILLLIIEKDEFNPHHIVPVIKIPK